MTNKSIERIFSRDIQKIHRREWGNAVLLLSTVVKCFPSKLILAWFFLFVFETEIALTSNSNSNSTSIFRMRNSLLSSSLSYS